MMLKFFFTTESLASLASLLSLLLWGNGRIQDFDV